MEEEALSGDEIGDADELIIDKRICGEEFGRWKRYLPTVYAVLRRLEVNVRIASSLVVIPRSTVASISNHSFLSSFESLYLRRALPHCLCVVTPRVEILSASGNEFVLDDGESCILVTWCDQTYQHIRYTRHTNGGYLICTPTSARGIIAEQGHHSALMCTLLHSQRDLLQGSSCARKRAHLFTQIHSKTLRMNNAMQNYVFPPFSPF